MSQLGLFDFAPPAQPEIQVGDVWKMKHHGKWTVHKLNDDGTVWLRGKLGFQQLTPKQIRERMTPTTKE